MVVPHLNEEPSGVITETDLLVKTKVFPVTVVDCDTESRFKRKAGGVGNVVDGVVTQSDCPPSSNFDSTGDP